MAATPIATSLELCTAGLGLFLAAPLLALARKRPANAWLAAFVASFASLALADFCYSAGIYRQHPAIWGLFDLPLACLGASFYCYTRGMTGLGVGRRQAWHLLPLPLWLGVILSLRAGVAPGWLFLVAVLALQLLTLAYGLAVLWRLRQYRHAVRQNFSSMRQRDLHWLSRLTAALMVLLLVWFPATLLGGAWDVLLLLGRLAVLCFAGWFGMRHVPVFVPSWQKAVPSEPLAPVTAPACEPAARTVAEPEPATDGKYARSGMTPAAAEEIGRRLLQRVGCQHDNREPELTLAELAGRVGTSPQLLSQYLNEIQGVTFYDYVNGLRVADVQRMMSDPARRGDSLLDLSLAAGFNSRSTFNAAFKKVTGMPPSQWRRRAGCMSAPIGQDDKQPA
ncbi:helix-turn-helix domain-containing protein [Pseudoduganella sp. R-32]|uniref:helix-turn-helix domain-containing protein n=1 Tax=Pseudoduganella sp. R-32 TaxID=3404061 RepID=UPI003CF3577B